MRIGVIAVLLLTGACHRDFDDQYAETERRIKAAEKQLDADMRKEAAKVPGEHDKK
jgi:hypothetical protein